MNTRPLFCMDTHAIYWRRIGSSRLSATADQVFEDAIQDKAILVVPYVVVAELFYLLQKHGQSALFGPLLVDFQSFPYYRLEPLTISDLAALDTLPEIPEMHDRLIALAGKRLGATIVTKDEHLCASQQLTCLW